MHEILTPLWSPHTHTMTDTLQITYSHAHTLFPSTPSHTRSPGVSQRSLYSSSYLHTHAALVLSLASATALTMRTMRHKSSGPCTLHVPALRAHFELVPQASVASLPGVSVFVFVSFFDSSIAQLPLQLPDLITRFTTHNNPSLFSFPTQRRHAPLLCLRLPLRPFCLPPTLTAVHTCSLHSHHTLHPMHPTQHFLSSSHCKPSILAPMHPTQHLFPCSHCKPFILQSTLHPPSQPWALSLKSFFSPSHPFLPKQPLFPHTHAPHIPLHAFL